MAEREYRFSFYLNALHAMKFDNNESVNVHPHTWEIILYLNKENNDFIMFSEIEKEVGEYLKKFEGKILNEVKEFKEIDASCENIGEVIFKGVLEILEGSVWKLERLEISENSTRTYIIKNDMDQDFKMNITKFTNNNVEINNQTKLEVASCIEPKTISRKEIRKNKKKKFWKRLFRLSRG